MKSIPRFQDTHSIIFLRLVGCGDSSLSILCLLLWTWSIYTDCSSPVMIFLRNVSFFLHRKLLVFMDMQSSLFFSLRVWETKIPSLLTFPIILKWQQIVDWDTMRWSAYPRVWLFFFLLFSKDCIPPILLKHLDRDLMRFLVWVHLLMMYHQNETMKNSFSLGDQ